MKASAANDNGPGTGKRIFLIDDHLDVKEGLKLLLEQQGLLICGEAGRGAALLAGIEASCADLVVLDVSVGGESGFACIAELSRSGIPVLVYTLHEDGAAVARALNAGAAGYISKREPPEVLLSAVSDVLAGKRYVSPRAVQSLSKSRHAKNDQEIDIFSAEKERKP